MRPFWATYYRKSDAVVMVVDSTDRARVSVCKVGGARVAEGCVCTRVEEPDRGSERDAVACS